MDADRMAINVLNGTLRLVKAYRKRTEVEKAEWQRRHPDATSPAPEWTTEWAVKKYPHSRADLISKLAPVKYAPAAQCADYDTFLARVQPDEHMRRFIHQWGGLSLTGDISEHKLAFFYGGGRNGKGTWVELVAAIAGEYAGTVQFESLADTGAKRRGDQATPDLARLPGVRFLRIAEPSAGVKFDDGLVKQLTGGDPVMARLLNKGFFEFLPSFKITISGNNKPNIRDNSHGFWARMQLVPWAVTIPESEIDHALPGKLQAQSSGVLNRLLEGLLDWRINGLIVPEQVRMATREYRDQSDDLGRFLAQCCVVSDGDDSLTVGARELFDVFGAWADATGGASWTIKGFKKAMEDRGFRQKASNGMKWLRIGLRPGVDAAAVKGGWLPEPDGPAAQVERPPEYDDFDGGL
jgi:putative DNA primase/helicase